MFYIQLGFLVVWEVAKVVEVWVVVDVTEFVVVVFFVGPVGPVVVEFPFMSQNSPIHGSLHKHTILPIICISTQQN